VTGLKVVSIVERAKPVDSAVLDDYEPLLLTDQTSMAAYWGAVEPLLQRVITKAGHGEFTTQDLFEAIIAGRMWCFVFKKDVGEQPDVALVIVLELSGYPRMKAMNIVAVGGREMNLFRTKFWDRIRGWAYMSGIRYFEALVSPAMQRILVRYGFKPVYTLVRADLTEI
jgi:hypothetical protein